MKSIAACIKIFCHMPVAITRAVPQNIARCELTHLERAPIDYARAVSQHAEYEAALRALGCTLRHAPAAHDLPDSVFVEDVAIVLDEVAIMTRPGAPSRLPEGESIAPILAEYRPIARIPAPGTLDGGDVLRLGRTLYVGLSTRTNDAGAAALARIVASHGYRVVCLRTAACLHLKSAATAVDDRRVLANPAWIDASPFRRDGLDVIAVDPDEPNAANVLLVGRAIVAAASHARTADILRAHGHDVRTVDVSELAKAEAGVTCCSLLVW
jgi:dimethylargininase